VKSLTTILLSILLWLLPLNPAQYSDPIDEAREAWVEEQFGKMSFNQKLGQLFTIRAHSDRGPDHIAHVKSEIEKYHIGGLCFFQGDVKTEAKLTNDYQALADIPLLVSMDAEWGVGMRLKSSAMSFPRQLMLGAIQNDNLLHQMGLEVADHCKRLGIHVNFAPVVDINNNAANPVINTRSFGEDKMNVTAKSFMYMKGMQDGGIMACAKHFPGHGDTDVDSHYDLPVISHDRNRLEEIELHPFRALSQEGIGSMMVAHLQVPVLDNEPNTPTTLSRNTVHNLLKEDIGFEGIIFTDGLEMKGVTKHHGDGEVEAKAIAAGNDMLLLPESTPAAINRIKEYLSQGKIDSTQIFNSCKKILRAKYDLGLNNYRPIKIDGIEKSMNSQESMALRHKLIQHSLTLVNNSNGAIPIKNVNQRIASVAIGADSNNSFQNTLKKYANVKTHTTKKDLSLDQQKILLEKLESYDLVIISVHDLSSYARKNFGLSDLDIELIKKIAYSKKSIFTHFGNPYALKYFDGLDGILQCYQEDDDVQSIAAQSIFGAYDIDGRLPVTASPSFPYGMGLQSSAIHRLSYGIPESVGMSSDSLERVAEIFNHAIDTVATPGGVVLVARKGKVVYEKAFGNHTYAKKRKTQITDIFDLASVTKTSSGTASIMRLVEEGKISLDEPIEKYLDQAKGTNKAHLTLREIMAHHGGLKPWIPFYKQTVKGTSKKAIPDTKWYRTRPEADYQVPVAGNLYMRRDFQDSISYQIYNAEQRANKNYRYSDLAFYMVADVVKAQSGKDIDKYTQEQFYEPLGMNSTGYNPHYRFDLKRLVPSENDKYFRNRIVQGYVHDMGAAQLGGISGHAGLFSSANDLAILYQMLLNQGTYGDQQYYQSSTVKEFTTRYSKSTRRGIGFDMRELDTLRSQNVSPRVSEQTFGHLGFTGTCVWVDPKEDLVIVILANRTFPSMNNNKWGKMNARPKIQTAIYNAIISSPNDPSS